VRYPSVATSVSSFHARTLSPDATSSIMPPGYLFSLGADTHNSLRNPVLSSHASLHLLQQASEKASCLCLLPISEQGHTIERKFLPPFQYRHPQR
jgi:hypothetical protein